MPTPESSTQPLPSALPQLLARSILGGTLMGLANLVPGISGGTMLLAAGIYPQFIAAVAEVTRLRFRFRSLLVLGAVAGAAAVGIFLLAGVLKGLVVDHRFVMYSLFIGLTLGGLPLVLRMARPLDRRVWLGAAGGLVVMVGLGVIQSGPAEATVGSSSVPLLMVAGIAGASAMILPGVSGGYLLLLLGQYLPILGAIDELRAALSAGDLAAAMSPGLSVLLPVAIGIGIGVVVVSNLLRFLLQRFEKATLGVLLGLLLGAVVGLWPFQEPIEPVAGVTRIGGQLVTEENLDTFDAEDFPTVRFRPSPSQAGGAVLILLAGLAVTTGVSRIGRNQDDVGEQQ